MSAWDGGGPAFPGQWYDRDSNGEVVVRESYQGASLRDYFAAKAMQAVIEGEYHKPLGSMASDENVAITAYQLADAMLAQREKES